MEGAQTPLLEQSQQMHLAALSQGPVDLETLLSDRHTSYQLMKGAWGSRLKGFFPQESTFFP